MSGEDDAPLINHSDGSAVKRRIDPHALSDRQLDVKGKAWPYEAPAKRSLPFGFASTRKSAGRNRKSGGVEMVFMPPPSMTCEFDGAAMVSSSSLAISCTVHS